jgi:hypothetical protein
MKFRAQSTMIRIEKTAEKALTCKSTRQAFLLESPETFGGTKSFVEFAARARALRSQCRESVGPCAWDAWEGNRASVD